MKRSAMFCNLVVVGYGLCVAGSGCASVQSSGFGPYPSSSLTNGILSAGVAGFIPGTVPQEGEFALAIINTDNKNAYTVIVTSEGGESLTRSVQPCNAATAAVSCTAESITVEIAVTGTTPYPSLTFTPDPDNCTQKVIYIEVGISTSTGTDTGGTTGQTDSQPPSLSETLPASAINCGIAN